MVKRSIFSIIYVEIAIHFSPIWMILLLQYRMKVEVLKMKYVMLYMTCQCTYVPYTSEVINTLNVWNVIIPD